MKDKEFIVTYACTGIMTVLAFLCFTLCVGLGTQSLFGVFTWMFALMGGWNVGHFVSRIILKKKL